jgi:DNA polymerase I-like protein with 3'-5' exonuclease and polymerase domains
LLLAAASLGFRDTMTKAPDVIKIDFETKGIEPRPKYPPKPVSLAIKWPDEREYRLMAWGHEAGGNNCTERTAKGEYQRARRSKYPIVFQNGMFDQDVAEVHWDIPLLPWDRYHDTMFLIFLWDPHAPTLALKPTAERLLGIKPEEQDRMKEWIIKNIPEAAKRPSEWGAHIWRCPYQIVAPYHKGDLTRTGRIFDYLYPRIVEAGMLPAYQRELKLMPILLRNARVGLRVDVAALERAVPKWKAGVDKVDNWLRKRLGDINIDSDIQLGQALLSKKIVTDFKKTEKGRLSVSKKYLTIDKFNDKNVYQALTYRGQMSTSVNMFGEPWLDLASRGNGLIHADWSQVRSAKGDRNDSKGARSGRIICSKPNLLNIPKKWKRAVTAGYIHPRFVDVPELPFMRTYILPPKGKQWGRRDYNQQEVRLFAHFEEGPVMQGFLDDPRFDMHEGVRAEEEAALIAAGLRNEFDRDSAKTTVFGAFYGQGLKGLMDALKLRDEDKPVGQLIQKALHRAAPSIRELSGELKAMAKDVAPDRPRGYPIETWGDRLYYCEPPSYSEKYNRDMTYEYKLIAYLIQGSGADVIKEAIVRYDSHPKREEDMLVTVYDELNISLPLSQRGARREMTLLRDVMQSVEVDLPMLSDGETGPSWGNLKGFEV